MHSKSTEVALPPMHMESDKGSLQKKNGPNQDPANVRVPVRCHVGGREGSVCEKTANILYYISWLTIRRIGGYNKLHDEYLRIPGFQFVNYSTLPRPLL